MRRLLALGLAGLFSLIAFSTTGCDSKASTQTPKEFINVPAEDPTTIPQGGDGPTSSAQ